MRTRAGWIVYVLALLLLGGWMLNGRDGLRSETYSAWSWYHYWFGSKYHQELGYFDIYNQTLPAWKDARMRLGRDVTAIRGLHSYKVVKVEAGQDPCVRNPHWTDARWAEFQKDLKKMRRGMGRRTWSHAVLDRGYNASPTWTVLAGAGFSQLDLGKPATRTFLKGVDIVPVFLLALALPFVFGPWRSLACMAAFLAMPPNPDRFLGSLVQYDWFVLVMAAALALRRDRHGLAGALLGFATMFRVFPVVFFLGVAARGVLSWMTDRRRPSWLARLAAGFGIAVVAGALVGSVGPRGLDAWGEWTEKMEVHTHFHKRGDGRVGLTHLFTDPAPPWTSPERPSLGQRMRNLEASEGPRLALQGALLLLLVAAAWRRDPFDCFVLALGALFVGTVASRYYWSVLGLLPLLGSRRGDARLGWLGVVWAAVPMLAWYGGLDELDDNWARWRSLNAVMLGAFTLGMAAVAWDNFFGSRGTAGSASEPDPDLHEGAPHEEATEVAGLTDDAQGQGAGGGDVEADPPDDAAEDPLPL